METGIHPPRLPYTPLLRLEGVCGGVLSLRGTQVFTVPHPALGFSNPALPVAFPGAGDPPPYPYPVCPDGPPGLELWRMPTGNIRRIGGKIQSTRKTRDQNTCRNAQGNRSRYLGTRVLIWCLVQSYLGMGSKVVLDDILVSVHTSSRATDLTPGEGRVWHTHSREVAGGGKATEHIEGSHPTRFPFSVE